MKKHWGWRMYTILRCINKYEIIEIVHKIEWYVSTINAIQMWYDTLPKLRRESSPERELQAFYKIKMNFCIVLNCSNKHNDECDRRILLITFCVSMHAFCDANTQERLWMKLILFCCCCCCYFSERNKRIKKEFESFEVYRKSRDTSGLSDCWLLWFPFSWSNKSIDASAVPKTFQTRTL